MMKSQIANATLDELVAAYEQAAQVQGESTENGDHKRGNKASDMVAAVYSELRRRGEPEQRALLPLLENDDPGIRLWAASHALDFSAAHGEPVLEALVPVGRFLGLSAQTTLNEWRAAVRVNAFETGGLLI